MHLKLIFIVTIILILSSTHYAHMEQGIDFSGSTSIIVGFSGNSNEFESYLKQFGIFPFKEGDYYLIQDSAQTISRAFGLGLPYYIKNNIFFIKEGTRIMPQILYSSDPYSINDLIKAYGISSIGSYGKNFTGVVLVPYGDPTLFQNLEVFNSRYNIPSGKIQVQYFPSPPRTFPSGWISETDLDVEIMHAIAPEANIVVFETVNDNSTTLEMALNYIVTNHIGDVVSMSWGGPELQVYDPFFHSVIKQASRMGITLVAASGDSSIVEYPASDPYVLSVGGTSLFLSNGRYYYESIWQNSGGGESVIFPRPLWQVGSGLDSLKGRGVPDISMDADPSTGVYVYSNGWLGMGGTSLSAPLISGIILDIDSMKNYSLGFFTPQLYYMHGQDPGAYFNPIYTQHGPSTSWMPQIGLGSPKCINWTFTPSDYYTSVYLGNYTNVENLIFQMRGIVEKPYHRDDSFSFFAWFGSTYNVSIGFDLPDGYMFYSSGNVYLKLLPIRNNSLYTIVIYPSKHTLMVDGHSFNVPYIPENFSLYVFSSVKSGEGFYTNLGPVEFRNFQIRSDGKILEPERIVTLKGPGVYGAFEIPFIYNDFKIGDVGNLSEDVLWPRSFNYIHIHGFVIDNTSIDTFPFLVGNGSRNDPYIISGVSITGNSGILIDLKGNFIFYHIIINAIYGVIIQNATSVKFINSKIYSFLALQSMFCTLNLENTTIVSIFSMTSLLTSVSMKNTLIYSMVGFFPFLGYISMDNSWIFSPIPFITNYFQGIPNLIIIIISILTFFAIWRLKKSKI
ncbi:MAG: S53 family peptidase [Thermoplasmata archaeon]